MPRLSSSPMSQSGPLAPAALPLPRSPTKPTRSSAPKSQNPSTRSSPNPSASSMAAPSNLTTQSHSASFMTSTERSLAEPASTRNPLLKSSTAPPVNNYSVL